MNDDTLDGVIGVLMIVFALVGFFFTLWVILHALSRCF